jgi:hypothetical protein
VDVNGLGDPGNESSGDQRRANEAGSIRGTPYAQADLRVARRSIFHDRWSVMPFIEFFNLVKPQNAGANFLINAGTLQVKSDQNLSFRLPD